MRGPIHILLAILAGSIYHTYFAINGLAMQIAFSLALIFGVLLPDIDEAQSTISHKFGWPAKIAQGLFRHRGFLHSVWIILILFVLFNFVVVKYLALNGVILAGLLVGYAAHLIGDAITVNGIKPFYPLGLTIRGPVRTGKLSELIVALLVIAWLVTH